MKINANNIIKCANKTGIIQKNDKYKNIFNQNYYCTDVTLARSTSYMHLIKPTK